MSVVKGDWARGDACEILFKQPKEKTWTDYFKEDLKSVIDDLIKYKSNISELFFKIKAKLVYKEYEQKDFILICPICGTLRPSYRTEGFNYSTYHYGYDYVGGYCSYQCYIELCKNFKYFKKNIHFAYDYNSIIKYFRETDNLKKIISFINNIIQFTNKYISYSEFNVCHYIEMYNFFEKIGKISDYENGIHDIIGTITTTLYQTINTQIFLTDTEYLNDMFEEHWNKTLNNLTVKLFISFTSEECKNIGILKEVCELDDDEDIGYYNRLDHRYEYDLTTTLFEMQYDEKYTYKDIIQLIFKRISSCNFKDTISPLRKEIICKLISFKKKEIFKNIVVLFNHNLNV